MQYKAPPKSRMTNVRITEPLHGIHVLPPPNRTKVWQCRKQKSFDARATRALQYTEGPVNAESHTAMTNASRLDGSLSVAF